METRTLDVPPGFDPRTQRLVGHYAAALDAQHSNLRAALRGAGIRELEWQPRRGVNTVGMLLAHLAVAECWWLCVVATDRAGGPDAATRFQQILGMSMESDGLPLAADGTHPESLSGRVGSDYDTLLAKAHRAGQEVMVSWNDDDLALTHRTAKREVSREWILYHVLEHFAAHFGQILLLRHLMRAEGLWERSS